MTTCALWPVVWPTDMDVARLPPEAVEDALRGASNVMWALTGRVYGICETKESYAPPVGPGCVMPYKDSEGYWQNVGSGGGACCGIMLANRPVRTIEHVWLNGVQLADSGAWYRAGNRLMRLGACWPSAVVCDVAPVDVAYTFGAGFPGGAGSAVGEVATELLNPLRGKDCRLPTRATSVTRNGVTVTMADAQALADSGLLGLPLADMLIRAVNPNRLKAPARVFSVDGARRRT